MFRGVGFEILLSRFQDDSPRADMFQHLFSECYADYHANSWTYLRERIGSNSLCLFTFSVFPKADATY